MQLARILLVLTALAVIGTEVTSFRFPLQIPTSISSWLPFTFNVTKDDTNLGSVTLNIKPKLRRQVQTSKIKREIPAGLPKLTEKNGRLNSKDSRLFSPLTERWELGIPSGASLTAGSVASLAGIIWTIIAKNLEYKKEHGELEGKDPKDGGKTKEPYAPLPPPSGSYNIPSYSSDYSLPPQKPEKGSNGFFKGSKGIKEMQAQAMKGLTRLVGLRDLNNLLHPGQKPKKMKLKKRPIQQQQYYEQPVYQSSYTPQEYPYQPNYEPSYASPPEAPAYAPPPEAPAYAPPPDYVPAPVYEQAPEPAYARAPEPAPVYVPEQAPVYAPAPEPAPVYAPPPVDVLAPPPNEQPAQYSPTNDVPNTVPMFAPPLWGISHQARAQPWNDSPAPQPDVSSLEPQEQKSDPASIPVAVFHSLPTQAPSTFISLQTNGFLPIFPSPVDPLPFMPSSTHEQAAQWPKPTGDVPSFGVAPSSLSPPPPRSSRFEDAEPMDPTFSVTEISTSQISEPLDDNEDGELTQSQADDNEDDELRQSEAEESLLPTEQWVTPTSSVSENTTSM